MVCDVVVVVAECPLTHWYCGGVGSVADVHWIVLSRLLLVNLSLFQVVFMFWYPAIAAIADFESVKIFGEWVFGVWYRAP